jgi:hypothetical protein
MTLGLNSKTLLPLVAVLLLLKFVLMPVFAWQNERVLDIASHEQKNAKVARLLASESQIKSQLEALSSNYSRDKKQIAHFSSAASFRIETKMNVDILMQDHSLYVRRFNWREKLDKEIFPGMYMASFTVNFAGKAKDFARLHAQLSTTNKGFRLTNFGLQVTKQSAQSMGRVRGSATIEAYYWLGEE